LLKPKKSNLSPLDKRKLEGAKPLRNHTSPSPLKERGIKGGEVDKIYLI